MNTVISGLDWVKISIANRYGLDKKLFNERIEWVEARIDNLEDFVGDAEEPELFLGAVEALYDVMDGNPTNFLVDVDATTSGYSIMSMLANCRLGMEMTNVIGENRHALYLDVLENMNDNLPKDEQIIFGDSQVEGALTYKEAKRGIMTFGYGSASKPKEIFSTKRQLDEFYVSMLEMLPGAMDVVDTLKRSIIPEATEYKWTLPDGHVAKVKVRVETEARIEVQELEGVRYTHKWKVNQADERSVALLAK